MKTSIFYFLVPIITSRLSNRQHEIFEVHNFLQSLEKEDLEQIEEKLRNDAINGYFKIYVYRVSLG